MVGADEITSEGKAEDVVLRAYKYRLYPNEEQARQINQTMGCARFVYNWGLEIMMKDNEAWKVFTNDFVQPLLLKYPLPDNLKKLSAPLKLQVIFFTLTRVLKADRPFKKLTKDLDQDNTTGEAALAKGKELISYFLSLDLVDEFNHHLETLPADTAELKDKVAGQWTPKRYSKFDLSRLLTQKKKDPQFAWLKEAYSTSLITALNNLDAAFQNFFKRLKKATPGIEVGYPKFKRRWNRASMQFHQHYTVNFGEGTVTVPKIGDVPCKFHRVFSGNYKTATISRSPGGRYHISILVECPPETYPALSTPERVLGIDHGIHHFITTSDGKTWERYRVSERLQKRDRLESRRLSRKAKDSRGRAKQRTKLARLKERIASSREGFIQHVSSELISYAIERGYDTLAFRDYDIKKMMRRPKPKLDQEKSTDQKQVFARNGAKNKSKLNREISNVAWGRFIQVLKSKGLKHGILVEHIVPAADTSITCSHCGHAAKENVKGRLFKCQACGVEKDVDLNAAINTRENYLSLRKPTEA